MIAWKDPLATLYCGDAREVLASLPAESVQCCITSPPYWGLRDYHTPPQVWGGVMDCVHEWGKQIIQTLNPGGKGKEEDYGIHEIQIKKSQFCAKCGAWLGSLGLEPTPDCGGWLWNHVLSVGNRQNNEHGGSAAPLSAIPAGVNPGNGLKVIGETEVNGSGRQRNGTKRLLYGCGKCYVCHIRMVFAGVKRVLRKDGTLWLNMGDSYWGGKGSSSGIYLPERDEGRETLQKPYQHLGSAGGTRPTDGQHPIIKPKDLCGIPWRVALALQADGWYLRSDIIWSKPNPMPESVSGSRWEKHRIKISGRRKITQPSQIALGGGRRNIPNNRPSTIDESEWEDCPGCPVCLPNDGLVLRKGSWRPTTSHEYVFMLAKSANYYADGEAVRSPYETSSVERRAYPMGAFGSYSGEQELRQPSKKTGLTKMVEPLSGANKRSVWEIATQPYAGAHFATFPEKLVEPCLLAGTSERGACPKCGRPWVRVLANKPMVIRRTDWGELAGNRTASSGTMIERNEIQTLGWRPACACGEAESVPCVILDCFAGSGTVGVVARQWGRKAVLIELSEKYCELAVKRLTGTQPAL